MNYLDSIQRREAIDEDKKIHKRALDSEFAFIKRLGEDTLPPVGVEKYQIVKLTNLIQQLRGELEGTLIQISNILNGFNSNVIEDGTTQSYSSSESVKALKYLDTGKAIIDWNNFVALKKTFNMSERQIQELWDYIHQNLDPIFTDLFYKLDEIDTFYPDTYELYDIKALEKLKEYVDNKQFNTIPALGKITPDEVDLIRMRREEERVRDEENRARELRRIRAIEGYRGEQPPEDGEELNFNPWEGFGKKRRKPKKKMDTDEFELNIEVHNKNMDKKQLKEMKKAIKKMPLPFDDGDDSNYLK